MLVVQVQRLLFSKVASSAGQCTRPGEHLKSHKSKATGDKNTLPLGRFLSFALSSPGGEFSSRFPKRAKPNHTLTENSHAYGGAQCMRARGWILILLRFLRRRRAMMDECAVHYFGCAGATWPPQFH
jgi:hypothetical protein